MLGFAGGDYVVNDLLNYFCADLFLREIGTGNDGDEDAFYFSNVGSAFCSDVVYDVVVKFKVMLFEFAVDDGNSHF